MANQDEIFEADEAYDRILENSEDEIEIEEPEQIPLIQQEIEEPIVKKDKRKGKRTKPISDEQRKRLCDNLARGRQKALETRRKNAQLKKIEREQKMDEKEERLLHALNKKKQKSQGNDDLLKKIADLEKRLLEKESAPPPQPKVSKPISVPTPAKKVVAEPKSEPKATPAAEPPQMSRKQMMKLMKSMR
tara:strand:+ start:181 stop:750 length:570 start_codon:yes stop_codon:yes gene_type:complete